MAEPLLTAENLSVFYGEYRAVQDASFMVREGELVSFIGANGAGKTSTIRAVLGLNRQISGRLTFAGRDLTGLPSHQRVRAGISIVPEGRRIFPELSVHQNLMIGAYTVADKAQVERSLAWVLERFPILAERRRQMGGLLSGGEQQMLAIARALMGQPRLLLIDEVSMGLMPIAVDKVFELIKELNQKGMTILLVEQNAKKALAVADRGYLLESGRIVAEDSGQALLSHPSIIKAYLGA